jgi:hypothetical protein
MLKHIVRNNVNKRFSHTHYINRFPTQCDNYKINSNIEDIMYNIQSLKKEILYINQMVSIGTVLWGPLTLFCLTAFK